MRELTDKELVRAILAGNYGAWRVLFGRHLGPLRNYVGKIVGVSEDANDIVQETFLQANIHLPTYDDSRGEFSTWLYRIARNRALDYLRHLTAIKSAQYEPMVSVFASGSDPELALTEREELRNLQVAFQEMPENYRRALECEIFEEKTADELASKLGVSRRLVHLWTHRGRQWLRDHWQGGTARKGIKQ